MVEPPVIERSPRTACCADTKLIAEPWDAAGLYQVGEFPSAAPVERVERPVPRRRPPVLAGRPGHDPRRWPPGCAAATTCTSGPAGCRCTRSTSSPATTASRCATWSATTTSTTRPTARATATASDENYRWNCGVEGPTDDPTVLALRRRQAQNLIATLLLSQGVPMLLAGDEFLRTQQGQQQRLVPGQRDRAGSTGRWPRTNADFLRFVREMIALRQAAPGPAAADVLQGRVRPARGGETAASPGTAGHSSGPAPKTPPVAAGPGRAWRTSTGTGPSRTPRTSRPSRG